MGPSFLALDAQQGRILTEMTMNKNYFVDMYSIHTFPANNLNRDENNVPKTVTIGGVPRIRISSQAMKRASRMHMADYIDSDKMGVRSLNVPQLLIEELENEYGVEHDKAVDLMMEAMNAIKMGKKHVEKNQITNPDGTVDTIYQNPALFFIGNKQLKNVAKALMDDELDAKTRVSRIRDSFMRDNAIDVSSFGRMVADDPSLNVDAAVQVAHRFSVDPAEIENDFFTAVDDNSRSGHAGSAMMENIEYDSSTMYGYETISLSQLDENLDSTEEEVEAVKGLIRGFVEALPTGKQNTFAAQTLPDAVIVTVREGRPVNYSNAFIKVIEPNESMNVTHEAIERLARYAQNVEESYGLKPVASFVMSIEADALDSLGKRVSLPELVEGVGEVVRGILESDDDNDSHEN